MTLPVMPNATTLNTPFTAAPTAMQPGLPGGWIKFKLVDEE
jgi:hypothetical protein